MDLDQALELAVVSSWEDLAKAGDTCSVHVEYENVSHLPLRSLEVWTIRGHGYGTLVCRYSPAANLPNPRPSEDPALRFANSYHSEVLADGLNFIFRNQDRFTRPSGRSVHGLVQVDCPTAKERSEAKTWSQSVRTEFAQTVWN